MAAPGVYQKEVDLSLYAEVASNFKLGMVHTFSKGVIDTRTFISNLASLESTFGKPIDDATHSQGFLAAREYFRYGNQLQVVRVDSAANPAQYPRAGLRGTTDETLETGTDGVTSIPATKQFTSATATFQTNGVLAGDVLEIHDATADDGFYLIASVDSEVQVTVDRNFPTGSLSTLDYSVWTSKKEEGTDGATSIATIRQFTSAGSTFLTNGVAAGDILYINDTGDDEDNGYYSIVSVDSEIQVTVASDFAEGELSTLTFTIYGPMHPAGTDGVTTADGEFSSATAKFADHGVAAGDLLIIEDTTDTGDNGTFLISGLKVGSTDTTLTLYKQAWDDGTLTGLSYRVVPGSLMFTGESKGAWANDYTIAATRNVNIDTQYDVSIYDSNTFLQEAIVGLTNTTVVASMLADSELFPTAVVNANRGGPAFSTTATVHAGDNGTTGLVAADFIGVGTTGLQQFKNIEEVEVDALIIPGYTTQSIGDALVEMAGSTRGDCIAILDAPDDPTITTPAACVDWHNGTGGYGRTASLNSSFGALYYSWVQTYDPYADSNRYLAPSGHAAAVWAKSENATKPWFAPAGLRRGKVDGAVDLRYSPDLGERTYMYATGTNAVNPIVNFVNDGIHIYGQKTLLRTTSALNRVNVRRMLLYLERGMTQAVRTVAFEPNDSTTDREIVRICEPLCQYVQDNRGINEFLIIVDDTTSPPAVRAQNKIIGKIFVKPTTTAEVIELQFVLTAQTISFSELLSG